MDTAPGAIAGRGFSKPRKQSFSTEQLMFAPILARDSKDGRAAASQQVMRKQKQSNLNRRKITARSNSSVQSHNSRGLDRAGWLMKHRNTILDDNNKREAAITAVIAYIKWVARCATCSPTGHAEHPHDAAWTRAETATDRRRI